MSGGPCVPPELGKFWTGRKRLANPETVGACKRPRHPLVSYIGQRADPLVLSPQALHMYQACPPQHSPASRQISRSAPTISFSLRCFPRVEELSDPVEIGVHPAEAVEAGGVIDRVPPYASRDVEAELHAALACTLTVTTVATAAILPPKVPANLAGTQLVASNPTVIPPPAMNTSRSHHPDLTRHHERIRTTVFT